MVLRRAVPLVPVEIALGLEISRPVTEFAMKGVERLLYPPRRLLQFPRVAPKIGANPVTTVVRSQLNVFDFRQLDHASMLETPSAIGRPCWMSATSL